MASLGDIFDFEKFNLKDMWGKIKDNPERLLLGAGDPFSSKLWGGITGKDYEPIVNEFGGPSGGAFDRAKASGIDTGLSRGSHDVAKVIAGMFAGNAGMNALTGAAPAAAAPATNAGIGADVSSALGTAGVQGGPGVVSAAPGAPTAAMPAAGGFNWQQLAQKMGNFSRLTAQEQDATAAELAKMGPPPPPPQAQAQPGVGNALAEQFAGALAPPQQRQLPRMTRGEANTSMGLGLV